MLDARPLAAPHAHGSATVPKIMLTVWLALLPASALGAWQFGWPALNLLLLTSLAALAGEAIGLKLAGKPLAPYAGDGSALLTGWLLAMTLPPWAPWWIAVVGGLFATVVGKQVFGGVGQNLFNPAMLARVALLISFPLEMTLWVSPHPFGAPGAPDFLQGLQVTFLGMPQVDGLTGATVLGHAKTEVSRAMPLSAALEGYYQPLTSSLGLTRGSLGETSALLILIGGLFLLAKKIISWPIPLGLLLGVGLPALGFHLLDPERYLAPDVHLLSGGVLLAAFFIATDPVGSPATPKGQWLFAVGCGVLIYVIRTWGGFPEGVAFAVLLMNAATPLIDHYLRPRVYGRRSDGTPLGTEEAKREARP